jgi:hypothetical protein
VTLPDAYVETFKQGFAYPNWVTAGTGMPLGSILPGLVDDIPCTFAYP